MKKLEEILGKVIDPQVDLDTDPSILALTDRQILLYILQVLARRFA